MKKVLSILLLVISMVFSACGGVKYEYKNGVMYGNEKPVTGLFEFKDGKYKIKGNFVNGIPDGIFEKYYPDGNIMIKDIFVKGNITKEELFYKNGQLLGSFGDEEELRLYFDDGQLVMTYDEKKEETKIFHENGNPMMLTNENMSIVYNENNEMLFKIANENPETADVVLNSLEDGSIEFSDKAGKVLFKMYANGVVEYYFATGETMLRVDDNKGISEFFFKNGNIFMKEDGNRNILNHKNGKKLYEMEGESWKIYDEEGEEIVTNGLSLVTDIKKLD